MERVIAITVSVSSNEHAELIRKDLIEALKMRATIYTVTNPVPAKDGEFVSDLGPNP